MRTIPNISNFKVYLNFNILNNILFIAMLFLGVYSVTTINDLAIKGYAITELQKELNDLKNEKNVLGLKVAHLRSYDYLNGEITDLNFVVANNIEYIKIEDREVVARK